MINIDELDKELQRINGTGNLEEYLSFQDQLLSCCTDEFLEYHYELFSKETDDELKEVIIYSFVDRKCDGEKFLIKKLDSESNIFFLALSIELLGIMKNKKSLEKIRKFLKHKSEYIRQRVCLALGNIGSSKDIKDLGYIQLNDSDVTSRELSPIAQMKISFRYKKAKEKMLNNFLEALLKEKKDDVIIAIGYATQSILERGFDIVEQSEGEYIFCGQIDNLKEELKSSIKLALNE